MELQGPLLVSPLNLIHFDFTLFSLILLLVVIAIVLRKFSDEWIKELFKLLLWLLVVDAPFVFLLLVSLLLFEVLFSF